MSLEPGDRLFGPLFLTVKDAKTGEILVTGGILEDMDIDPREGLVTIEVNNDVGYGP